MLKIAIAAEFELAEKIVEALEQTELNVEQIVAVEIYPFAEEQGLRFNHKSVAQMAADEVDWSEFQYAFFATDVACANYLLQAANAGVVVLDLLGICAGLPDVPAVIPTINEAQLSELHRNIVSLPNPQVTQVILATASLLQDMPVKHLSVTSLLPASYTNGETVNRLAGQTAQLLNGIPLDETQQRLAFDVFPQNGEPLAMQVQSFFPQLESVVLHAVQVPVFYGMSQKVTALCDYAQMERQIELWQQNPFIQYDAEQVITPVINGECENGEADVKLHISGVSAVESGISFWTVADEQRFNIAFLGVKLLEGLYREGY
ncbi:oxidoreductase [Actinobacillus seminis]|uniref:oxidoreductase n=1 Tax=Actinobacillus seminis TaxID=722 RepID=UPI003B9315AB